MADEKRILEIKQRQQKLRSHIAKVEEVRKEQAVKRKQSQEHLKSEIDSKLGNASLKREEQLEHRKNVAQRSAEKRHSTTNVTESKNPDEEHQ